MVGSLEGQKGEVGVGLGTRRLVTRLCDGLETFGDVERKNGHRTTLCFGVRKSGG